MAIHQQSVLDLEIFAQAIASSRDHIAAIDTEYRFLMVNEAYARFHGCDSNDLLGRRIDEIHRGSGYTRNLEAGLSRCFDGEAVCFEEWQQPSNGETGYFSIALTPLHRDDGGCRGVLLSAHEVTELQRAKAELERLAHHDALTGLPNRVLLEIILERSLKQARRDNSRVALMFIDLDRLKAVNDSLGHAAGDVVLREAARRLRTALRDSDSLARVGGDEFVAVLSGVSDPSTLPQVANKLMAEVSHPYHIAGEQALMSCSIGISLYPDDGASADELLTHADTAMYEAKAQGRNDWRFFRASMTREATQYMSLVAKLRSALQDDSLDLVFLPEFDVTNGSIVGVEALTRWQDSQIGQVTPEQFIRVAEKAGLVRQLDLQSIDSACARLAAWQEEDIAPRKLALNISSQTLHHPDTPSLIEAVLERHGIVAQQLELEVNERALMLNPEQAASSVEALQRIGIGLVIDDFGSSAFGLGYLQALAVRALKIHGSRLEDIDETWRPCMARAMIAAGRALGLGVVLSHVESDEQAAFLKNEPGLNGQGFFLARPLEANEVIAFLRGEKSMCSGTAVTG